jgi:uncharacterized protein DUF4145
MKCPHCANGIHDQWSNEFGIEHEHRDGSINHSWAGRSLVCPLCGNLVVHFLRHGGWVVQAWPRTGQRPLPAEVTDHWKEDFGEAVDVLGISPKASAALSRRMLQDLLREKGGVEPSNFFSEIEEVRTSGGVPSWLSENLHTVRIVGNWALTPRKSTNTGDIVEVEPGEAEFLLDVLEGAFDFYIVQPEKARLQREALTTRIEGSRRNYKPTLTEKLRTR